jgi:F0F1-type ATP synthase assembly protein I
MSDQITSTSKVRARDRGSLPRKASTIRIVASIVAIALVLPAIGMIIGGFSYHRPFLGAIGIALMVGLGLGYYIILRFILKDWAMS